LIILIAMMIQLQRFKKIPSDHNRSIHLIQLRFHIAYSILQLPSHLLTMLFSMRDSATLFTILSVFDITCFF
jgi:hypothetical protein